MLLPHEEFTKFWHIQQALRGLLQALGKPEPKVDQVTPGIESSHLSRVEPVRERGSKPEQSSISDSLQPLHWHCRTSEATAGAGEYRVLRHGCLGEEAAGAGRGSGQCDVVEGVLTSCHDYDNVSGVPGLATLACRPSLADRAPDLKWFDHAFDQRQKDKQADCRVLGRSKDAVLAATSTSSGGAKA